MGEKNNITLGEYIKKNLVIPAYQRGYVWSKKDKDHVTKLLDDLVNAFDNNQTKFMQAITVYEEDNKVNIVDGQQRTITFYLLLAYLNNGNNTDFKELTYRIRKESNDFLQKDIKNFFEEHQYIKEPSKDEEYKDLYFFKRTLYIFNQNNRLQDNEFKNKLKEFILKNVSFLYIPIAKEHVKTTFTMMNGNKAQMRSDELIKAELLRLISIDESNVVVSRARVAKEWERWIQWWNRNDVKSIFNIKVKDKKSNKIPDDKLKELTLLLYNKNNTNKKYNFNHNDLFFLFKSKYLQNKNNALNTFNELRKLQKKFEDIYNIPTIYNKVGFILKFHNTYDTLLYILKEYNKDCSQNCNLNKLYHLSALHDLKWHDIKNYLEGKQFTEENDTDINYYDYYKNIIENATYENNYDLIYAILLLLNIKEDNKLNRKFDFNITKEKSIEHIFPQSKFKSIDENNGENTITSDKGHSIGNLVLLYGNENSALNNKEFLQKKEILFNYSNDKWFKRSIHLLDTIKEFSKAQWGSDEIDTRKDTILTFFDSTYKNFNNFKIKEG